VPDQYSKRLAVVGGGIAGLSAAWLLSQTHRVTLFEAEPRLGGHTHTVDVTLEGVTVPVDTGFLVYNERTYPALTALFRYLDVQTVESDMSFSVRIAGSGIEWAGSDLNALFAQRRNLLRPAFWQMLRDILRFNREATALAASGEAIDQSLGGFLSERGFGAAFRDWYLLPMAGAIWSCPPQQMLSYPARTFFRFCANHGLLQISDRPRWRTVTGGGRRYVERLAAALTDIRMGTPVQSVRRTPAGVELLTADGGERFDGIILACHSDQSLRLLADADDDEHAVLGAIPYQVNEAVLHTDERLLPRSRRAWSAWNYHAAAVADGEKPVGVSYLINRLQPLPFAQPVIVTLNPTEAPREEHVLRRLQYAHPVFDIASDAAQTRISALQGRRNTWYCGAWTGYGFHEDGLRSALAVAADFGVVAPWRDQPVPLRRAA
jgi:predicted NAD/FAD-binding protein